MRYSLLAYLACPVCPSGPAGDETLVCYTTEESAARFPAGLFPDGARVSAGAGLGPVPAWRISNDLTALLDRLASLPADAGRGLEVEVASGLLICGWCGRWFPIERGIPELLPDHLRDAVRETALLAEAMREAPSDLHQALQAFRPSGDAAADPGAHYKKAEIGIRDRIDDPEFFGPGYSSPFNPWNSAFTAYLLSLFGTVVPMLDLERGGVAIDSGCGYAWTTEWLFRSGYDAIGVDICRTYLEIAVARMGAFRPHLVIGDVESLPLRDGIADAILAYESFHHVPDRNRALAAYHRVLGPIGTVVLAEPGAAHEQAAVAIDAMEKYGILERGMELSDVVGYVGGTPFNTPEQVVMLRTTAADLGKSLDPAFVKGHSVIEGNLFRLTKGQRPVPPPEPPPPPPPPLLRRGLRRLKSALSQRPD